MPATAACYLVRMRIKHVLFGPHWRERLLLWAAAGAVGIAAVIFAKAADFAQLELRHMVALTHWSPWASAPVGFFCIAWMTRRYFPGAEGSGIPQSIFALRADAGDKGRLFLRPIVVAGRVVLATAGLFCGGSIGREGPTVHVGAVIFGSVTRWMPKSRSDSRHRMLVLAGGAAGVAAAFNTPLAGVVFAIEELSRSFDERASGTTLTAVILAGVVAIALVGDYTYFGLPVVPTTATSISWSALGLAIVCGITGGGFSRITLATALRLPGFIGQFKRERPALFAACCGLCVAALGTLSGELTYGTGYEEARGILVNNAHLSWIYAPARAAATLLSYLSGIPAGLLAPSLSVGAGIGQTFADGLGYTSAVPFAILGMCGYLAGVTQAPLTSFVIVMEMTAQHAMVLPLMITAALATAVSKLITPPLYQTLANRYSDDPASSEAQYSN